MIKKIKHFIDILLFMIASGTIYPRNGVYRERVNIICSLLPFRIPENTVFWENVKIVECNRFKGIGDNCSFHDKLFIDGKEYNRPIIGENCTFEVIYSNVKLKGEDLIVSHKMGSRHDYTYYFPKKDVVICGCFKGTLSEFETKVNKSYPKDQGTIRMIVYGDSYRFFIGYLKELIS